MRMATGCPSIFSCACEEICCCICAAALSAASALGKVAITSSPMDLITVPSRCSVAFRITSMQIATMSRARTSPMLSYSRVEPTTSANTMASSMSFPMSAADYTHGHRDCEDRPAPCCRVVVSALGPRRGRDRAAQELDSRIGGACALAQYAPVFARAGLAGIKPEHVACDRGEALAARELARGVTLHALDQSDARRPD